MKKVYYFFYTEDITLNVEATTMQEAHVKLSEKFGVKPFDVGYMGHSVNGGALHV